MNRIADNNITHVLILLPIAMVALNEHYLRHWTSQHDVVHVHLHVGMQLVCKTSHSIRDPG